MIIIILRDYMIVNLAPVKWESRVEGRIATSHGAVAGWKRLVRLLSFAKASHVSDSAIRGHGQARCSAGAH